MPCPATFRFLSCSLCTLSTMLFWPGAEAAAQSGPSITDQRVESSLQADTQLSTPSFDYGSSQLRDNQIEPTKEDPASSDFGEQLILRATDVWQPWRIGVDFGYSYNTNVALTESNEIEDWVFSSAILANYSAKLRGNLFAEANLRQSFFRYSRSEIADVLDFDLLQVDLGLAYVIPQLKDTVVYTRYGYQRLTDGGDWADELYTNHTILLGGQKVWRPWRGHQFYAAVSGEWSLEASEERPQRDEYGMTLGYNIQLTSKLRSSLLYRLALHDYELDGRYDFNQNVGVGLSYQLTHWCILFANAGFTHNDSSKPTLDYDNFSTGINVGLQAKF